MKKVAALLLVSFWSISTVSASIDDTSVIDAFSGSTQELKTDIWLESFQSCQDLESVMEEYMKEYWKLNYKKNRWGSIPIISEKTVNSQNLDTSESTTNTTSETGGWKNDYSKTNTQVFGVDEADIVKTDGKYHYYFNDTQSAVYIVDAEAMQVVKKINLPKDFYGQELYIWENRLVILASAHAQNQRKAYYFGGNQKTYTIVFDTKDVKNPELIKLYTSEGNYTKSRKIGDLVYVLSQNYFNYPYWDIKNGDDIKINANDIIPKKLDISRVKNINEQNLEIKGKKLPYSVTAGNVAGCQQISYHLPNKETLKDIKFNPGYNVISVIDTKNPLSSVETTVIAGNNTEVYMSQKNLYLTEWLWQENNFSCPPDALCALPFFWGWTQNTLIHKLNITGKKVSYQDSAIVPGSPLNQYSMDEYEGDFRIITSGLRYDVKGGERSTGLYVLDKDLKNVAKLTDLAPWEVFQSSRFIGDKLFLVTFEQIDPLFAIDLAERKNPKILGELKIPGYSTYLHPYDATHLIGLGFNTEVNQWGGTQNSGIKLDLYKINYDKKCGDTNLTTQEKQKCQNWDYKGIIVEQLQTKTFGDAQSSSEALHNPRMFIWNKERNTLLLPAELYTRNENQKVTDFFNGLLALKITPDNISEIARVTHIDTSGIEEKIDTECKKYTGNNEPVCRKLRNGEIHCDNGPQGKYIPDYCYADANVWSYVAWKAWEFHDEKLKRALYIGESVYGFSDTKLWNYDWKLKPKKSVEFK